MRVLLESGTLRIDIDAEDEMDVLGRVMAEHLQPGDVVCLDGTLGAGKTRLVRAITNALDCEQLWAGSPTFVLVQEYAGRLPIYHMDAYRLKDSQEFYNLGGEDYLWGDGVCLIEWSRRIADALPDDALHVTIDVVSATARRLTMAGRGDRSTVFLGALAKGLDTYDR